MENISLGKQLSEKNRLEVETENNITMKMLKIDSVTLKKLLLTKTHSELRTWMSFTDAINQKRLNKSKKILS